MKTTATKVNVHIERLDHVWQVVQMWPAIATVAGADGNGFDATGLLQQFTNCLQKGAVFVCFVNGQFAGYALLQRVDKVGMLYCLPTDCGCGLGKITLQVVRHWAFQQGLAELQITITSMNGSNHHYVRKHLGFHRKAETFALKV